MTSAPPIALSTEEKFKEAARIVFMRKGYAATKTRDIAEQAGQNLALLNYYFRSKENLFEIVMAERIGYFFGSVAPLFQDPATTLEEKIEAISTAYVDILLENPDLPLFILSELRNDPERFSKNIYLATNLIQSTFARQLAERKPEANPVQLFMTFLGMLVFPFVMKPVMLLTGTADEAGFAQLMQERKTLVAQWMHLALN